MTEAARLSIRAVAKSFGATRALVRADLTVQAGQVHTLLGENGSGKSTLVKVLGGVYRPHEGELLLDGAQLDLRSPDQARRAGIAPVFQEVLTAGAQSVLDNVWLGSDGVFAVRGGHAGRRARASQLLAELLGRELDLDAPAASLSLSDRQAVCITRALVADPKVLILDESTASLDIATRDRLFECVRRLTAEGTSVLFISHRMDEITEISDVVTVLRSGSTVATVERADADPSRLLALMTGAEPLVASARMTQPPGELILRAADVRLSEAGAPIDFELHAGELVGLAGLEGHGQEAFLRRLAGLHRGPGTVLVRHGDGDIESMSAPRADRLRIAYLPRERRGESLFSDLSIRENFALPTLARDSRWGWWSPRRTSRRFTTYRRDLKVRMHSDRDPISTLSGGNQQKVVMSRWIASNPRVLLLNDPTRGVDLGTKRELYVLLDRLCREGLAVVMLSSEMDELIELMDRVLVFRDMAVSEQLTRSELSRQTLAAAYFGQAGAAA